MKIPTLFNKIKKNNKYVIMSTSYIAQSLKTDFSLHMEIYFGIYDRNIVLQNSQCKTELLDDQAYKCKDDDVIAY